MMFLFVFRIEKGNDNSLLLKIHLWYMFWKKLKRAVHDQDLWLWLRDEWWDPFSKAGKREVHDWSLQNQLPKSIQSLNLGEMQLDSSTLRLSLSSSKWIHVWRMRKLQRNQVPSFCSKKDSPGINKCYSWTWSISIIIVVSYEVAIRITNQNIHMSIFNN